MEYLLPILDWVLPVAGAVLTILIAALAKKHLRFPVEILVKPKEKSQSDIRHKFELLPMNKQLVHNKMKSLKNWLGQLELQIIIFTSAKRSCETLAKALNGQGFKAIAYHSGYEQARREESLAKFKNKYFSIKLQINMVYIFVKGYSNYYSIRGFSEYAANNKINICNIMIIILITSIIVMHILYY